MVDESNWTRSGHDETWVETADRLDLPSRETCLQLLVGIRFDDVDVAEVLAQVGDLKAFASWIARRRDRGNLSVACPEGHEPAVVVKNGSGRRGEQRYHCRRCRMTWSVLTRTIFSRHQLPLPLMVYLVSHLDSAPAIRLAANLPVTYRTVSVFIDSARKTTDQHVVDVIRHLSIGTPPDELSS